MLFQAENYVCYIIYDARSLEANQVGRNMLRDTRHLGIQSSKQMICVWAIELLCRSSHAPAYHSVAQTNPLFTKARR